MKKPVRTCRIHHKSCPHLNALAFTYAFEPQSAIPCRRGREFCLVEILNTERLRFACEKMVEVRPIPMRVRHFVVRTRCDQQLVRAILAALPRLAELVMIEREPTLQPTRQLRVRLLPGAPFTQGSKPRQVVSRRDVLEKQVGQRRRRFPNREAWMRSALDHHNRSTQPPRHHRQKRPAESRAH